MKKEEIKRQIQDEIKNGAWYMYTIKKNTRKQERQTLIEMCGGDTDKLVKMAYFWGAERCLQDIREWLNASPELNLKGE